jgi:dTDP-4-dehydrorhamnose reductase
MTIAVTGSAGQLGAELCRQLGAEAVGLDLPDCDLTDRDGLWAALQRLRPQAVINAAAYTRVDQAETDVELCELVNARGVAYLVEACRRLDCPFVQVSTDYVFGGDRARRTPYRETDEPAPRGVYARTKLEGERYAQQWPQHYIVRTCGLYGMLGPRSAGNFVATMLRLGQSGRPLRVVNDQRCTPSYVPQVARAIRFLLSTRAYGLYHVVNAGETTWYHMAVEIFRQVGLDVSVQPITSAEYGARAPRPLYSVLDTAKYQALPGAPVLDSWQQALHEYLSVQRGSSA